MKLNCYLIYIAVWLIGLTLRLISLNIGLMTNVYSKRWIECYN